MPRAVKIPASFDPTQLEFVEIPEPASLEDDEVRLRMRAVSLNYRDLLVVRGFDRWRPPVGRIPVSDGVGIVEARSAGVKRVQTGQRVITTILPNWIDGPLTASKREGGLGGPSRDGVLAETVVLKASAVVPVLDYLTDVEAATLPCAGVTAWHALTRANSLRPSSSVLVQGTGGVALFAVQLAVSAGANVIAISSSTEKCELLRRLGADQTINYRESPDWHNDVMRLTDGRGVDHVIDIGGASTLRKSMLAIGYEGVVSIVGLVGGMIADIDIGVAFQKNLRLDGVETGSRTILEDLIRWMEKHEIHPVIDSVHAFESAAAAFERMADNRHVGKVCIQIAST